MAQHRLPRVLDGWLRLPDGTDEARIALDSAEWYAWLADERNSSFSLDAGGMVLTVRREPQRHGWYWYAYRKQEGRLRKAYLGKGEDLTAARLGHVARTLVGQQPAAATTVRLGLLGAPWFARDDQQVSLPVAKAVALLTYLAVSGVPQARDQVLALLWPESPTIAARKNLRNALWAIGAALGPAVLRPGTDLALRDDLWIDLRAFERRLAGTSAEEQDAALALYRGPLLDGLIVDDAPDFELWLAAQRERLSQAYLHTAHARIAAARSEGNWQQVRAIAGAALAHDAVQEPLWHALIEAHGRLGERAEALRAYETLRATLERELGVAPVPATDALRRAIARGDLAPAAPMPPPDAPCPMRRATAAITWHGPFVGRERELAALDASLETARLGRPRVVILTGDTGIGKSRLWHEWSARLGAGVRVLEARCLQMTQPMPFAPVLSLFDDPAWTERLATGAPPSVPAWAAEIARLMPAVPAIRQADAAPEPSAGGDDRCRVFEALMQAFLALSTQPLVVCIDDLQWADGASLDWLGYLLQRLHDRPLLLVLAFRLAEAPDTLAHRTAGWCRQGLVERIALAQRGQGDAAALVAALGGDVARTAALHAQSGGNPLMLSELLRAAPGAVPPILTALIGTRIDRLPEAARQVLQAAAILEPQGDFASLRRTGGHDEDATLDALDLLLREGLLVERGEAYDFPIPLVAAVLRGSLSAARRASLHRRAAAALEELYAGRLTPVAGRLARHYGEAGEAAQAAHYAQLAADHAMALAAPQEAVVLYRQALAHEQSAARHMGLGQALHRVDDREGARQAFEAARRLYDAGGDRGGAGRACVALAENYAVVGKMDSILHWALTGVAYLDTEADAADRGLAQVLIGIAHQIDGRDLAAAEQGLEAAVHLARGAQLDELAARGCWSLGNVRAERGNLAGALQAFRQAIAHARGAGDDLQETIGHNNLAYHAVLAGDLVDARTHVEAGMALATARRLQTLFEYLYSTRAELALAERCLDEAEEWCTRALAEAHRSGNAVQVAGSQAQLGRVAQARGDLDGAVLALEGARAAAAPLHAPHLQAQIDLWLADLYLERGERTASDIALARAEVRLDGTERAGLQVWAAGLRQRLASRVA